MVDGPTDMREEAGWKLLTGDVFRAPEHPQALCVYVGSGTQVGPRGCVPGAPLFKRSRTPAVLGGARFGFTPGSTLHIRHPQLCPAPWLCFGSPSIQLTSPPRPLQVMCVTFVTLVLATLGFLSPASRGALLTTTFITYVLMSVVAGAVAVFLWGQVRRPRTREWGGVGGWGQLAGVGPSGAALGRRWGGDRGGMASVMQPCCSASARDPAAKQVHTGARIEQPPEQPPWARALHGHHPP
jgi:hypothetical protein